MDLQNILRTIQPFLAMFVALFVAFLTATWIAAVIWAFRDIRARTRDVFAQVLATLLVLIFFPLFPIPGLILYAILRPRETLADAYERTLEEEALLHGIEERLACPGCNRRVQEDYVICPTCHTRLKKVCGACGRSLHLAWSLCPYCGSAQAAAPILPTPTTVLPAASSTAARLTVAVPAPLEESEASAEAEGEPVEETAEGEPQAAPAQAAVEGESAEEPGVGWTAAAQAKAEPEETAAVWEEEIRAEVSAAEATSTEQRAEQPAAGDVDAGTGATVEEPAVKAPRPRKQKAAPPEGEAGTQAPLI